MNPATSQAGAGAAGRQVTELRLPDFIVIGAMRSGTTSLANFLNRQPRLRDPAQRAQSHYWHRVARDIEHLPLVDALRAEEARMADPATTHPGHVAYVDRSRYGEQLQRYREVFPPDRLRVLILEEVDRDPVGELTSLLAWLAPSSPGHEVTSAMWPQQDNRHLRFRSQRLRTLVRRTPGALGTVLGAINAVREPYPAPSRAAAAFIRSRLRDDRRVLEDVLGRPVDVWSPL